MLSGICECVSASSQIQVILIPLHDFLLPNLILTSIKRVTTCYNHFQQSTCGFFLISTLLGTYKIVRRVQWRVTEEDIATSHSVCLLKGKTRPFQFSSWERDQGGETSFLSPQIPVQFSEYWSLICRLIYFVNVWILLLYVLQCFFRRDWTGRGKKKEKTTHGSEEQS